VIAAALSYLEVTDAHPVLGAEAGHRTTGGPGELAMLELILAALIEAGLSREDAVRYYPLPAGCAAATAAVNVAYRLQDDRVPLRDVLWCPAGLRCRRTCEALGRPGPVAGGGCSACVRALEAGEQGTGVREGVDPPVVGEEDLVSQPPDLVRVVGHEQRR